MSRNHPGHLLGGGKGRKELPKARRSIPREKRATKAFCKNLRVETKKKGASEESGWCPRTITGNLPITKPPLLPKPGGFGQQQDDSPKKGDPAPSWEGIEKGLERGKRKRDQAGEIETEKNRVQKFS